MSSGQLIFHVAGMLAGTGMSSRLVDNSAQGANPRPLQCIVLYCYKIIISSIRNISLIIFIYMFAVLVVFAFTKRQVRHKKHILTLLNLLLIFVKFLCWCTYTFRNTSNVVISRTRASVLRSSSRRLFSSR